MDRIRLITRLAFFMTLALASEAAAMAPPAQGSGGGQSALGAFLPIIIIFILFYFLLIRPQQKRQKEIQEMLANIKKGDKVVTTGGIYGLVEQVGDKTVVLKVAENTRIKFGKAYIAAVRSGADED